MKASVKITRIGNSADVVLRKELLLKIDLAKQIMREDRDILRILGK